MKKILLMTVALWAITLSLQAQNYLTFTAEEANATIKFDGPNCEYRLSGQSEWIHNNGQEITLTNIGDQVQFRCELDEPMTQYSQSYNNYYHFTIPMKVAASGNIMSLMDKTCNKTNLEGASFAFHSLFNKCIGLTKAPELPATILAENCYCGMFDGCTNLTNAPELPATTLADWCYGSMFGDCTNLTKAPELPATTLADWCYVDMFYGCTNLTTAPQLPATTLAPECYVEMFYGCTSLTTAPELPATILANECYVCMFGDCTNLTNAPELPATTLADYCYDSMFSGCTKLTNAPQLPATTLADDCYDGMFSGCTNLTTAPELPATTLADYCYRDMFSGCTKLTNAPSLPATTLADYCYDGIFSGCTKLTNAPSLPATMLAAGCYYQMFDGCTKLTNAPSLPVTTLASSCYNQMFKGCTSLATAPELPATALASSCYNQMFKGCTSLATAPELPATALADNCYQDMFNGCTNLATAPELPATALADNCYRDMFNGCTGLICAPKLSATTLKKNCYYQMFRDCKNLTTIPTLHATTLATGCYYQMFYGCSNLRVNTEGPGREWSIPVDAGSISSCSYNMFAYTGGKFKGTPTEGTVYYVASGLQLTESFSLEDGESYIETEIEVEELTYTRTFSNTAWQSMYVPFNIPVSVLEEKGLEVAEIYNVHQYDRDDDGVYEETNIDFLKMKSGTALANYPYMVRAKEAGDVTIVMENTVLYNAVSASIDCSTVKQLFTFTGTYDGVSGQVMYNNNYYAMNGNGGLQRAANQSVSLKAQRWYLSITNRDGLPMTYYAPNVRITVDGIEEEGLGTSIDGIASLSNNESVYSITGICINNNENLAPGIYVKGGKKFIVK